MTAIAACRTCGTEPLENARFCHGCGSPVKDSGTRAEYKQVTVLFADVVHSMEIAAAVGAERLREIMTELVDRATAVVKRYGGTVDKFTGDGIMAVFGAPAALEDHALRACLAALGIQDEVTRLAAEVDRRDGVELRLRVGLNSGQVIAGEIGPSNVGYTAIGEQVGMAQRMESVAPPGGVMLSESTARLVENTAVLGEPELVQHQGHRQQRCPQGGCWPIGERRPRRRGESTLVGRTLGTQHRRPGSLRKPSGAPGVWSTSWGRRASARADWSAKPRRSRPSAVWRCSPLTASRIPATSRFTWWHGCCAQPSGVEDLDASAARGTPTGASPRRRPRRPAAAR